MIMTVKARITHDHKLIIAGKMVTGSNGPRIDTDGNLYIDKLITKLEGYDGQTLIDGNRTLDDQHVIDDEENMSFFLSWFFGVQTEQLPPNRVSFRGDSLVVNNLEEEIL